MKNEYTRYINFIPIYIKRLEEDGFSKDTVDIGKQIKEYNNGLKRMRSSGKDSENCRERYIMDSAVWKGYHWYEDTYWSQGTRELEGQGTVSVWIQRRKAGASGAKDKGR